MTDLDEWFARCDDILTDWEGSNDSMNTAKPNPLGNLQVWLNPDCWELVRTPSDDPDLVTFEARFRSQPAASFWVAP